MRVIVSVVALSLLTLALYYPTLGHGFLNYDDNVYVTENPQVRKGLSGESLQWALTKPQSGNYHPLTMLSHMLDVELSGLDPAGHHRTNLLLPLANVLLLFGVLTRYTRRVGLALLVAGLFAVHPLNVQSVAWIAERKNLLSTTFFFLGLLAYAGYASRPTLARYLPVLGLMILGLASKPMVVTFPLVLLLLDAAERQGWTALHRPDSPSWPRLILEKTPMLASSLACGLLTMQAQSAHGAMQAIDAYPFGVRLANAASAGLWYLERAAFPFGLSAFYPHPGPHVETFRVIAGLVVVVGVTVLVIWKARSVPFVSTGWLWYLVTLAPVIGIVQVGSQAYADRYAYLPLVGIFLAGAAAVAAWLDRRSSTALRRSAAALACLVVLLFALVARSELTHWKNSVTLFRRAVEVTTANHVAHGNLALAYVADGRVGDALQHFHTAGEIAPHLASPQMNLANALTITGARGEARRHYERAMQIDPEDARIPANLGLNLLDDGQPAAALAQFERAMRLDPDLPGTRLAMGRALLRLGRADEAVAILEEAVRENPRSAQAHARLAAALAATGATDEAIEHLESALARTDDPAMTARIEHRLSALRAEGVGSTPRTR
jgi:tetratricopeptide (TPR) repeat protein